MHLSAKLKLEASDQEPANQEASNQPNMESERSGQEGPFAHGRTESKQSRSHATKKVIANAVAATWSYIFDKANAILNGTKQRFSNPVLASNAYRYLARQVVQDLMEIEGGKSLVFSSGTDMTTNSEVLLMFSHFLQDELSSSVIIIDATFKANGLTQLLKLGSRNGIMDILSTKQPTPTIDSVIYSLKENVSFIARGNSADHPVPYVTEQQAESIISELTQEFDYVIFQQDQIQMDTRYLPFAKSVDLVLVHLEERSTRISSYDEIKEVFADHQIYNTRYLLSEH